VYLLAKAAALLAAAVALAAAAVALDSALLIYVDVGPLTNAVPLEFQDITALLVAVPGISMPDSKLETGNFTVRC